MNNNNAMDLQYKENGHYVAEIELKGKLLFGEYSLMPQVNEW